MDCKYRCDEFQDIVSKNIDRIAQLFYDQTSLIDEGYSTLNLILASKNAKSSNQKSIPSILDRLRQIRGFIKEEASFYLDYTKCCGMRYEDFEVLMAYYLEAGIKKEEAFIKELSKKIDTEMDLADINSMISLLSKTISQDKMRY
ncbi:MAG: hypothetical protein G5Z42_03215 [Caldisphaeraceae archaeon]|nr:hypothetical protein [Caldisphaeraceae archaeon]MEB3691760.1 hypothetical protein [Caldisphaeraceae archaeon]MEB3797817.1 hypothetical protein [Caldisphaeraceae archaeon]